MYFVYGTLNITQTTSFMRNKSNYENTLSSSDAQKKNLLEASFLYYEHIFM